MTAVAKRLQTPILLALIALASLATSGCANFNSIYRDYLPETSGTARSAIVDVKQRAILSNTLKLNGQTQNVTCAEPSPDALSVIASGLSASGSTGAGKALDIAFSQSETSAFIGNRTATIQLLRDMLYRACEMYMAGGIDKAEYYLFQRRYQIMTMGLLAIEQITGTVRVNPSTFSAGGAEATSRNQSLKLARNALAAAMAAQKSAKDALDAANNKVSEKKAAAEAATVEEDKKAKQAEHTSAAKAALEAKSELNRADALVNLLQGEYELAQQGGVAVRVGSGAGLALPQAGAASQSSVAPHPVVSVAQTSKEIVQLIVDTAFEQEECFSQAARSSAVSAHCFAKNVRQAESASNRCEGLRDSDRRNCLAESVPAGVSIQEFYNPLVLQSLADPDRPTRGAPRAESVRDTVKAVLPNPRFDQLRYDVFAVEGLEKEQKEIADSIRALGAITVRERGLRADDCAPDRYNVGTGHSIRFDGGEASEERALARIRPIVAKALGKSEEQVVAKPVTKPTPLYMSVLLCGRS